jgi:hypothetical protein
VQMDQLIPALAVNAAFSVTGPRMRIITKPLRRLEASATPVLGRTTELQARLLDNHTDPLPTPLGSDDTKDAVAMSFARPHPRSPNELDTPFEIHDEAHQRSIYESNDSRR